MGRHPRVFSLALPVPGAALLGSAACRALEAELRAAPFARKIAWDLLERRLDRLHATICGSLAVGEKPPLDAPTRDALAAIGPVQVELRGLFSGDINLGRLYLRVHPERRDGADVLRRVQRALGRRETGLYLVGVFNLADDLDAGEAAALGALIERWWDRPLLRFAADRLWLLGATDDLVLDAPIVEDVPLVSSGSGRA